jgi:cation-transporting ATPase 13A2
MLMYNS